MPPMNERKNKSASGKQRREQIKQKRLDRARRLRERMLQPDGRDMLAAGIGHAGMEPADREILARHNNTYGPLPEVYIDRDFVCRDCGEQHVWTAKQQKWWYEVAHGHIDSMAVRCLSCRRARRARDRGPGSDLLRERCASIRALASSRPDAEAVREIDDALASKWWGVRTVAIATLGRWGDAQSVGRLKAIVEQTVNAKRWGGWTHEARRAAIAALGECLPASEHPWAVELFLRDGVAWELHPLLSRLPVPALEAIVDSECRHGDPERLQRLLWPLSRAPVGAAWQREWARRFQGHPNPNVRRIAAYAWPKADGS
jgi:Probable zinc-ribbon domain